MEFQAEPANQSFLAPPLDYTLRLRLQPGGRSHSIASTNVTRPKGLCTVEAWATKLTGCHQWHNTERNLNRNSQVPGLQLVCVNVQHNPVPTWTASPITKIAAAEGQASASLSKKKKHAVLFQGDRRLKWPTKKILPIASGAAVLTDYPKDLMLSDPRNINENLLCLGVPAATKAAWTCFGLRLLVMQSDLARACSVADGWFGWSGFSRKLSCGDSIRVRLMLCAPTTRAFLRIGIDINAKSRPVKPSLAMIEQAHQAA